MSDGREAAQRIHEYVMNISDEEACFAVRHVLWEASDNGVQGGRCLVVRKSESNFRRDLSRFFSPERLLTWVESIIVRAV